MNPMSISKRNLTHTFLASLKSAEKIREIFDTEVPGFGVRVSPKGKKTFFLLARFGGPNSNPTRRAVGHFDSTALVDSPIKKKQVNVSLADARDKARTWRKLIESGIDPQTEIEKQAADNALKAQATFNAVAEQFIAEKLIHIRRRTNYENNIRNRFMKLWGKRPVSDIRHEEIVAFIRSLVREGKRSQARACLSQLRCIFKWARTIKEYGLEGKSPVAGFDAQEIIGPKGKRERTLNPIELKALWLACDELTYPWRQIYQLLILTGQRVGEIAGLSWSEVDLDDASLKIPATRMKSKRRHVVPLPPMALEIVRGLPRFEGGFFCFSSRGGKVPVTGYSFGKRAIDRAFANQLRTLTGSEKCEPWVTHDIRRTVRSGLSDCTQVVVAEAVLAHQLGGLLAVYDLSDFDARKREALTAWERKLCALINPTVSSVIAIRA